MDEQDNTPTEVKAFLAKVTFHMVVMANKESDAADTARANAVAELENQLGGPLAPSVQCEQIWLESVPGEWVNALPYIAENVKVDEDKTCKELLSE